MLRNTHPLIAPLLRRRLMSVFAVFTFVISAFLLSADMGSAQTAESTQNIQQVANAAGVGGNTDLIQIIARIINIFLGFLGVVLLVILLYAGFLWMTAGGEDTKVKEAKLYIRNAVIGLVIIVSAWAIVNFIFNSLLGATGGGSGVSGERSPFGGFSSGAGSLGGGIIESHYPPRNATNIARNSAIIITFKKPLKLSSVIADYNDNGTPADLSDDTATEGLNTAAVKIYRTDSGVTNALASDRVRVRFTADRQTFVFKPVDFLGTSTENVGYTVELMGDRTGLLLENGDLAFEGLSNCPNSGAYCWTFETGTFIDLTPPQITSVVPMAGNQYARNIIVQLNFNEAVDPTAVSGFVNQGQGFQNIQVHGGGIATASLDGEYRLSNQYRTVEFVPAQSCGRNSCGRDIFCLPGGTSIDVLAKAATLDGAGPGAQFLSSGYDGVVDVSGNSMDGNKDGTAQGSGVDDYSWAFGTSNDINRAPPAIEETVPPADPSDPGQSRIDPFAPVLARFDSLLQSSTVNTENVFIQAEEPAELADTFWWQTAVNTLTGTNEPVAQSTDIPAKGQAVISHRIYGPDTNYNPFLLSGIQNIYQNCFNPASGPACPYGPGGVNCCQGQRQSTACQF